MANRNWIRIVRMQMRVQSFLINDVSFIHSSICFTYSNMHTFYSFEINKFAYWNLCHMLVYYDDDDNSLFSSVTSKSHVTNDVCVKFCIALLNHLGTCFFLQLPHLRRILFAMKIKFVFSLCGLSFGKIPKPIKTIHTRKMQ